MARGAVIEARNATRACETARDVATTLAHALMAAVELLPDGPAKHGALDALEGYAAEPWAVTWVPPP
jgi:hypothetical protein